MQFFIDTADLDEIKALNELGFVDGVTTNPTLIMKSGKPMIKLIEDICAIVKGPVSAEVAATDYDGMIREGRKLAAIADHVAVKVPLTMDGLRACRTFSDDGIMVNVTLCFSAAQALLAAKAGATFISPFVGRLDDIGADGMELVADILSIYEVYPDFHTQVLVASVRHINHVLAAAKMGADIATCPPDIIKKMFNHPLTDKGLAQFVEDWKKTGQTI
jgi:transaldolase